jgi:hypothetical protein
MRPGSPAFSTQMKLPCTVLCGPEAHRLSGTALKIEPESMVLQLAANSRMFPRVGEKVDLEVHLPVNSELAGAKDLSIRGLIVEVTESRDGVRRFVLSFRRAHFRDRNSKNGHSTPPKRKAKAASEGWEM